MSLNELSDKDLRNLISFIKTALVCSILCIVACFGKWDENYTGLNLGCSIFIIIPNIILIILLIFDANNKGKSLDIGFNSTIVCLLTSVISFLTLIWFVFNYSPTFSYFSITLLTIFVACATQFMCGFLFSIYRREPFLLYMAIIIVLALLVAPFVMF